MARTVLSGEVHVHYGQIYVESDDEGLDLHDSFAGQSNGLCGASTPGGLFMITGLHTGKVGFTVEVHDEAPPVDESWEEIVEVSFTPLAAEEAVLVEWAGSNAWPLGLAQVDYRVRYSGSGMDAAREFDTRPATEPQQDQYLLQFWPAPPAADRVLRQTGAVAAYWHDFARGLPPEAAEERV